MGSDLKLLIVYPSLALGPEKTLWEMQDQLSLSNVMLFTDLQENKKAYDAHRIASTCATSCIYDQLLLRLKGGYQPDYFAPHLLNYWDNDHKQMLYQQVRTREDAEFVDLGRCYNDSADPEGNHVGYNHRMFHNRTLELPGLSSFVAKNYHIPTHGLLMWEDCGTIATWLCRAERQVTQEWKMVTTTSISRAQFVAWREYLREIGSVGAKAIFFFSKGKSGKPFSLFPRHQEDSLAVKAS